MPAHLRVLHAGTTLRMRRVIGRGSGGKVYLAMETRTGAMMAAKALKSAPGKDVAAAAAKEVIALRYE